VDGTQEWWKEGTRSCGTCFRNQVRSCIRWLC